MISIKKRLLFSILSVISVVTIFMVGITYYTLKGELDELFDENMKQLAHAIAVSDLNAQSGFSDINPDTRTILKGEEEFLIQIWKGDELSYASLPNIEFAKHGEGGVRTVLYDQEEWRYYGLAKDDWLIQVSQSISARHAVIWEFYGELLIPILLQLPILAFLIWLLVGRGFRPLKKLSNLIEKRSSTYLEQLPEGDVPEEVKPMVAALNDLLARLETALDKQRRFTADAAHELRTPLTAVKLQLDILGRAKNDAERQEAIQALYEGVDRSAHLVAQLLELARQEPDAANNKTETFDLRDLCGDIIKQHAPLADDKNIKMGLDAPEAANINADKNALSIMIGNVLNNAILYTPSGGKVALSLSSANDDTTLVIADNGQGIPENHRSRIFDRFYRVEGTETNGSGLGLSIVKTIADRHGIALSVGGGPDGHGTRFSFRFKK